MALFHRQLAVTTTPTALSSLAGLTGLIPTERRVKAVTISIDAASANTVYGGGANVTNVPANAGFYIAAAGPRNFVITGFQDNSLNLDEIYLVATGGATTCFMEAVT